MHRLVAASAVMLLAVTACGAPQEYDVVIRNGTIYDGSGGAPYRGDLAIDGDRIAAVGSVGRAVGMTEIDAAGLAVSPGFINMLSWANESLIEDGLGQSDIRQGVTLEVFGEGSSMGPLSETMKEGKLESQGDIRYPIEWTTLGEYLEWLTRRGVAPNVASFVGATTVRIHVLGYEDVAPTETELDEMRALVAQAMEEGALGVGSSLIYSPAYYAGTDELIALAEVAGQYGGMYISHIRGEGNRLLENVEELITIAREAGVPAEIYHLKASGRANWDKLNDVIRRVEEARDEGLRITADMYTYHASSTGLDAVMPPWVQEGGHDAWVERLKDPAIRERVKVDMNDPAGEWDNTWLSAASPDNILLTGFRTDSLRYLTGRTVADVARMRGTGAEETAMDLVIQDNSRVQSVFFTMSEDNIRRKIAVPWVSFCSDAGAYATGGVFLNFQPHPRGYGSFARLLGMYVRDEKVIPLEEAVRRLTSLPAGNLGIRERGSLEPGYFADVVVFDPETIADRATFEKPHQYAVGVHHVFVNGEAVITNGGPTGAKPGRVVRGPGWAGWTE
ncbi:MAG: D-aminoacylase [Gemmatimonadota bacterium]|jgi:N-acyl-D-amino-acid deacylase